MYTTMDYDFFEQSYYYTQPTLQDKTTSDDVSRLIYPVVVDRKPKEQEGKTTEVVFEDIISPLQSTPLPSIEHPEFARGNF